MAASVALLQAELFALIGDQILPADTPFLGNLTLSTYHALPDQEKAQLWNQWADVDLLELEEQEVALNALPS